MPAAPSPAERRRAGLTVVALTLGTSLNALNSSMIAVALPALQREFGLDLITTTWVITVFSIASIIGQPLMGRFVDAFGARKSFLVGMAMVVVASVVAPLVGGFVVVCVTRAFMALGTSVAFPAAFALVAPLSARSGIPTVRLLARIQVTNTAGAALGPVLGGALVTLAGWQAVFLVNVPLALGAIAGVAALAPRDAPRHDLSARALVANIDPLGVVSFGVAITALVVVALETQDGVQWWLLAIGIAALALFVWWERRLPNPFIDVRMLVGNPALRTVYLSFPFFSALFYFAFLGLPQFLQDRAGYSSAVAGLLLLPLTAATILLAPLVARLIARRGVRPAFVWGGILLIPAAALLGIGAFTTEPGWMLVMAAAIGVPYCLVSLAATQTVQQAAPRGAIGVASGLLGSTRFIGSIAATVILGRLLSDGVTAASWGTVAIVAAGIAVVHLAVVLAGVRRAPGFGAPTDGR